MPVTRDGGLRAQLSAPQAVMEFKGLVRLAVRAYDRLVKGSAVRQSVLAHQQKRISLNAPEQVTLPAERFAVASVADLTAHAQDGASAQLRDTGRGVPAPTGADRRNPALAGQIQVVSHFELSKLRTSWPIEVAKYQFQSWGGKGISAQISEQDSLGNPAAVLPPGERASVPIGVSVNATPPTRKTSR